MKITIKQLQGSQCSLEVDSKTTILNIKQQIEKELNVPVASQRLLHLGKALTDEQEIGSYPAIKDGTKLNLAVKKPDGLYDISLKEYKKMGLNDVEAADAAKSLLDVMKQKFEQLSWDDVDQLVLDFLLINDGMRQLRVDRTDNTEEPNAL